MRSMLAGPCLLQRLRARHARGLKDAALLDFDAASRGNLAEGGADIRRRGVAQCIASGADVDAELASTGDHVDGAARHVELAHGADEARLLAAARLHGEHHFGGSGGGVPAQRHRHRSRVARQALDGHGTAHAARDVG